MTGTNNLRLPTEHPTEPMNPIHLQRGERLVVTRRGNRTIYEVRESPLITFWAGFWLLFFLSIAIYATFSFFSNTSTDTDSKPPRMERRGG